MHLASLDLETYYDDDCTLDKLTTYEYAAHPSFLIHMAAINGTLHHDDVSIEAALDALPRPVTLIGHNVAFDGYVLYREFGFVADRYICTSAMARGWESSRPANLAAVCERLWPDDPSMRKGGELEASKGLAVLPDTVRANLGVYCLDDERLSRAIYHELLARGFPEEELEIIDLVMRMAITPTLEADYELLDKAIDEEVANQHQTIEAARPLVQNWLDANPAKGQDKKLDAHQLLRKSLSSNKRFARILGSLGVQVPYKTSLTTGRPTEAFGKSDVAYVQLQAATPHLAALWAARAESKSNITASRGNTIKRVADACDGNVPVPLLYSGAHTHRFSGGGGINMQNLPRGSDLRKAMLAPAGHQLVVSDLSAIEARVLAWLSGHHELLDLFRQDADVYCWFASKKFGREITKADKLERQIGKACILGLGYRMGADRFRDYMEAGPLGAPPIPTTYTEARETVMQYRQINWPVPAYWALMDEAILAMSHPDCNWQIGPVRFTHETCWLPNGLPIRYTNLRQEPGQYGPNWVFDGRTGPKSLHGGSLTENVDQALAACILKWQMRQIRNDFNTQGIDARLVMQVHDELVYAVPDEHVEAAMPVIQYWMAQGPSWAQGLPLACEADYARNYSK